MLEEIHDDQSQEKLDWAKYWSVVRRRCWQFVLPFFVGWAVVWSVSWLLPSVYRSTTLILVEHPSNTLVVNNNGTQDAASRMESISEMVTSRTNLLHIAGTLGLYADQRASGKLTDDELVDRMRKNIEIEVARTADRDLSSFNIYYSSPNPDVAQQVTTELSNALISGTLQTNQAELERQSKFLDNQLAEARTKLADQEEKVRQYKDRHMGELPGQLAANLQILSGLQTQLQGEQDALGRAKQQNAYLESLLSQYNSLAVTSSGKGADAPVGLPALDLELDREKAQLADLTSHYTDQHPDVRKMREQIAKTQKMKDQLLAQLKEKSANPDDNDNSSTTSAPLMEVRSQLKANQLEISNRQHAVDSLQAKIGDYQGRLNSTPVREQELADLTRDDDQLKAYYDQLQAKKNQAGLAANFSREQQDDRFTIQDPPTRPTKPYSPNRFKLSCMGLFAGLAMGLVVAGGAEFLDDRIYDEDNFKQMIPAEVLVEIPALHTPLEEHDQKRWQKLSLSGMGIIGIIVAIGTAISFLRG